MPHFRILWMSLFSFPATSSERSENFWRAGCTWQQAFIPIAGLISNTVLDLRSNAIVLLEEDSFRPILEVLVLGTGSINLAGEEFLHYAMKWKSLGTSSRVQFLCVRWNNIKSKCASRLHQLGTTNRILTNFEANFFYCEMCRCIQYFANVFVAHVA